MLLKTKYSANLVRAGLIIPETRIIAQLMLAGVSGQAWHTHIVIDNILQTKTRNTSLTYASLARCRLNTMTPELWTLVAEGSLAVATQAVTAATVKYSPLLGDFMRYVLTEEYRLGEKQLRPKLWPQYIEQCHAREPQMPVFSATTEQKLRQNAMRILCEAGYLSDTKARVLQQVHLEPELLHYLRTKEESYVLECLQVVE
jgi:hypothetical protein